MAVISSTRMRTAEEMTENQFGQRSYSGSFKVVVGDVDDDSGVVLSGARSSSPDAVPALGASYSHPAPSTDAGSFAQTFRTFRPDIGNPLQWQVDVGWAPLPRGTTQAIIQQPNPLLHDVVAWIDWVEEQVPLDRASNVVEMSQFDPPRTALTYGPVVNAAGEEFTTPIMTTFFRPVLNFQKNYATLNEVYQLNSDYQFTTNSVPWFSPYFPARTAKFLVAASGPPQTRPDTGGTYYQANIRVEINLNTWDRYILNIGFKELALTGGGARELRNIKVRDEEGNLVDIAEPVQLKADGSRGVDTTVPNFLQYRELTEVAYAGIGVGG